MIRRRLLLALLVSSGTIPAAHAVETQTRLYRQILDFAPGEMDHVSLSSQGRVVLSPDYRRLSDLDEPVVWAAAPAPGGDLYVATGHEGRVLRVPAGGGRATVAMDTPELEVMTLAVDAAGVLYAGTSPDGRVWRAAPGEAPAVFFDPEERYIWAVLLAPDASLYVATGDKGAVYRVAPGGQPTAVLAAEETHILSLALSPDGTLFAGSGGNGYIYRIDRGGETRVLLDTAGSEVKALALDAAGNLFAASTGRSMVGGDTASVADPLGSAITAATSDDSAPGGIAAPAPAPAPLQQPQPSPAPQPTPPPPAAAGVPAWQPPPAMLLGPRQSWLYRVRKDGLPEEIWRSTSETVHAMALSGSIVVLGTGDEGRLYSVDPASGEIAILLDLPGAQVTAIAARGKGLAIATSNLAAVWEMDDKPAPQGVFTSAVIDAGHFATWGRIEARGKGTLAVATRSGNTEKPGSRWSPWEDAAASVRSPKGRYLQYRVTLSAAQGKDRPEVHEIELAFLPHNLAPRLRSIALLDPHIELISTSPPPQGLGQAAGRSLPPTRNRQRGPDMRLTPREQETYGARSARWEAEDANGDQIVFEVSYRAEGESTWKRLASDLYEPFLAFDATAFAEGSYVLRVEASDAPSNPDDRALRAALVSEPFVIDNAPPRVEIVESALAAGRIRLRAELSDRSSALRWAEYSLDGGPWRPLLPADQVFDEKAETLEVEIKDVPAGEHSLLLRCGDAARNVGSARTALR